ncbi:MAG: CDP-glycerol glycerophosphotransferase family protein [Spirochaetes bacterium]|nr:CDP-glycerol glycerophosphotransferase family protein [Spirochaetota bacterium]MBN2770631.1 CDP-glycerol glycerophosphotransferase family protein [Spirochaetota bacterium]
MINIILDSLLFFFSYIIPKNSKLYVFGAGDGHDFKGNTKYVFLHCVNNMPSINPVWVVGNRKLLSDLKKQGFTVINKYSIRGFFTILRAKFLFIEIMPRDIVYAGIHALGRFSYIQTFHGMPLKKIGNDANDDKKGIAAYTSGSSILSSIVVFIRNLFKKHFLYKRYMVITSSGFECTKCYKTAFGSDKIVQTGFARNDVFFNKDFPVSVKIKDIVRVKHKKVISYIPTFRDECTDYPFTKEDSIRLDTVLAKTDAVLCIKKHPYDTSLSTPVNSKRIFDVSHLFPDVMELLVQTDILITDYSSVLFDFSLLRRPIIFYCFDYPDYVDYCRGMYYDYHKDLPGPFADNPEDLFKLIETANTWFGKKSYQKKFMDFINRFNDYQDGDSSLRLIDYLSKNKK